MAARDTSAKGRRGAGVADFRPQQRNANRHTIHGMARLEDSIRRDGYLTPMTAAASGEVFDGSARLETVAEILDGVEPIVVESDGTRPIIHVRTDIPTADDPRAVRLALAANKIAADNLDWDASMLAELREEGATEGLFSDEDLARILASAEPDATEGAGGDEFDTTPEEGPTRVQPGELWAMGEHRLLCGDSRDFSHVERLLGGERINVCVTSPPYASQRAYDEASGFKPIPPDEYVEWFDAVQASIREHLAPDGSFFLNIKPSAEGLDTSLYVMDLVVAMVRRWGWHFATEFCWERNGVPKSVTQRFKNQFEPIYQFAINRWKMRPDNVRHQSPNVPRAGGPGVGETSWANKQGGAGAESVSGSFGGAKRRRNGTTQFMADVQGTSAAPGEYIGPGLAYPGNRLPTFTNSHDATGHTAAFPVGLPEFFVKAYADPGDVIYEPFCGSGSTMIAAERTHRKCRAVEISAAYCDVILRRWEAETGRAAERIEAAVGVPA
jgi:DNA modification methylase